jgi:hypothetical protein
MRMTNGHLPSPMEKPIPTATTKDNSIAIICGLR